VRDWNAESSNPRLEKGLNKVLILLFAIRDGESVVGSYKND